MAISIQISPDYFTTLGIPLVRGRFFSPQDRLKTEQVAIIDETLAHQYWPNEDPLGQHINFGGNSPWMTIVGLVKHAKTSSLEADNTEGYYLPADRTVSAELPRPSSFAPAVPVRRSVADFHAGRDPRRRFQPAAVRPQNHGAARRRILDRPPFPGGLALRLCGSCLVAGRGRTVRSDQLFRPHAHSRTRHSAWRLAPSAPTSCA